jgi:hypothetical protein
LAGTLPFVGSLYSLNREIFSETEIDEKMNPKNKPVVKDAERTDFAIAIGVFKQPLFD